MLCARKVKGGSKRCSWATRLIQYGLFNELCVRYIKRRRAYKGRSRSNNDDS